jgi:hypothetical protein
LGFTAVTADLQGSNGSKQQHSLVHLCCSRRTIASLTHIASSAGSIDTKINISRPLLGGGTSPGFFLKQWQELYCSIKTKEFMYKKVSKCHLD